MNRIRKFPDKKTNLLKQEFVPPLPKQNDDTRPKKPSDVINGSIQKEHVDQLKSELEEARDLKVCSCYQELAEVNVLVLKLTKDLQDTSSDLDTVDKEHKKQVNVSK